MNSTARNWRAVVGGVAAGSAALLGFAGASASAEPDLPVLPVPAPATVTQTVTVTPQVGVGSPAAAQPAPAAQAAQAAPAAVPGSPLTPATSDTLAQFLDSKGVRMEPQQADGFTALNIVLPMPSGWSLVPDPNVPNAFAVTADRDGGDGLYTPNAQLMVYKLNGDFDTREAISHGWVESQKLPAWQSTDASMADFGGLPSSFIEGTYRENDLTLNTSRRHVIAQSGADRYLVSLSVTTAANQVVAAAEATDAIVTGFRVSAPAATRGSAAATTPAATTPALAPEAAQ
jgi:hypothetical protein